MSCPTSSRVRYSRGRRSALVTRRGGTFPFTMVGAAGGTAEIALRFIAPAYQTFPFMGGNGKVRCRLEAPPALGGSRPCARSGISIDKVLAGADGLGKSSSGQPIRRGGDDDMKYSCSQARVEPRGAKAPARANKTSSDPADER